MIVKFPPPANPFVHTQIQVATHSYLHIQPIPHHSEKTDAFAFGVCLYEMVARVLPWKGKKKRGGMC